MLIISNVFYSNRLTKLLLENKSFSFNIYVRFLKHKIFTISKFQILPRLTSFKFHLID